MPVVNDLGAPATLYGWIDADENGSFQAGEAATVEVPAGATSATLEWTGLLALPDGARPMIRLRLTSAALADAPATAGLDERSRGPAPDGEVEDHRARVGTDVADGCANPFVETFGTGTGYGPPLPAGQTTYAHESVEFVNDGEYALVSSLPGTAGPWWHEGGDRTPGDTDGRMMLVNADLTAGTFFQKTFTGLRPGATYDFSAWITNANNAGSAIVPNVSFVLVDPETRNLIRSVSTGDIPNTSSLEWNRYGLQFVAPLSEVRVLMMNNAAGGNGNDLAIDDIAFNLACDWGDAPASYGTTAADDGPVHALAGPMLGDERDGGGRRPAGRRRGR
ncbi:GEVED domain-containing protein [Nocardioides sp. TF02-7]|uniref:GEVED domain-containing protein n=1 Tax=Nocardioides sp. TF02-7 TaxID=2917724 RepID=UPI001F056FDE|nr:GEVED domain-containing protein [Nocardioides sp. TF02-7]UMG93887.1 GEVED domain-containing protein [Nocardioides sp. TF02-7]